MNNKQRQEYMEFAKDGMVNAIILVDNEVKIMKQLLQASSQNHPTKCIVYNITYIDAIWIRTTLSIKLLVMINTSFIDKNHINHV